MYTNKFNSTSKAINDFSVRGVDDDDIYSGFDKVPAALDTRNIFEDELFQEALRTTSIGRKVPSRMGTAGFRQGTASVIRLSTGLKSRGATGMKTGTARPMTAVRAAGYTSSSNQRDTPTLEEKKEDTMEDKIKQLECRIMSLIEESCSLSVKEEAADGLPGYMTSEVVATPTFSTDSGTTSPKYDLVKALEKAQEASSLERQLIRMQEQAGLGDSHNLDLTFAVLCNLAGQYAQNEMYTEALNTYQLLIKNKLFPHANRLKVNMGNIYFKMGEHPKALKLYRMALDQTPTAEKDLRMKVLHNIGLLLVRMGKFRDAVGNFQHIMHEQGDVQTGLHLVLCQVALGDVEGAKAAFQALLDVEPTETDEESEIDEADLPYGSSSVWRDVVRGDRLSVWRRAVAAQGERALLHAAEVVAPLVDGRAGSATAATAQDDDVGFAWCISAMRSSGTRSGLAARLEARAALARLRSGGAAGARAAAEALKTVARAPKADRVLLAEAKANLAFIALAGGDAAGAMELSRAACIDDPYSASARVTSCLSRVRAAGGTRDAWRDETQKLADAADLDPTNMHAAYYAGLCCEQCGDMNGAVSWYTRVRRAGARASADVSVSANASLSASTLRAHSASTVLDRPTLALARLARLARLRGDFDEADHLYQQLLATQSTDIGVLLELASMHDQAGDPATAHHYYSDVESVWPCSMETLQWLGEHEQTSRPLVAISYYRRAARLCPNDVRWGLRIGACLRAAGKYQDALTVYKKLHDRFPDNVDCLKLLVKLCGDQGLPETETWSRELKQAQRLQQQTLLQGTKNRPSLNSADSSTKSQSPATNSDHGGRSENGTGAGAPSSGATRSLVSTAASHGSVASAHPHSRTNPTPNIKLPPQLDDDLPLPPE